MVCKYHGYPRVEDYYKDTSADREGYDWGVRKLNGTKVPLLVVRTINGPTVPVEVVMVEQIHRIDNVVLLTMGGILDGHGDFHHYQLLGVHD